MGNENTGFHPQQRANNYNNMKFAGGNNFSGGGSNSKSYSSGNNLGNRNRGNKGNFPGNNNTLVEVIFLMATIRIHSLVMVQTRVHRMATLISSLVFLLNVRFALGKGIQLLTATIGQKMEVLSDLELPLLQKWLIVSETGVDFIQCTAR